MSSYFHGMVGESLKIKESGGTMVRIRDPKIIVSDPVALERLQKMGMNVSKGKVPAPYAYIQNQGVTYRHLFPRTKTSNLPVMTAFSSPPIRAWKPTTYQRTLQEKMPLQKRFLVYWAMGSGKTYGVLYSLRKEPKLVIICPLTLIRSAWLPTLAAITDEDAVPQQVIDIMGPDEAKTRETSYWRDAVVVIDEVHVLRNSTDLMIPLLQGLRRAKMVIGLSGTPIVNSIHEADYLFELLQDPQGKDLVPWARQATEENRVKPLCDALQKIAHGKVSYYAASDMLPPIDTETIRVPMTPYQTMRYLVGIRTTFEVGSYMYQSARSRNTYRSYEKQVCNCIIAPDHMIHCPKIDVCISTILANARTKNASRQAVYCHYIEHQMKPLVARLAKEKDVLLLTIHGQTSLKDRQDVIRTYNQGGSKPIVLVFSDAGNHGVSLKRTSYLHVMDVPDNEATYHQVIYRGARKDSHAPGERLVVLVYVAIFPAKMPDMKKAFCVLNNITDDDWTWSDLDLALKKAQKSIGGITVEEDKWSSMQKKSSTIQPLLTTLQRASISTPAISYVATKTASTKSKSKKPCPSYSSCGGTIRVPRVGSGSL